MTDWKWSIRGLRKFAATTAWYNGEQAAEIRRAFRQSLDDEGVACSIDVHLIHAAKALDDIGDSEAAERIRAIVHV